MRFAALAQKFEVVQKSHWFSYRFVILSRVIVINALLDSKDMKRPKSPKRYKRHKRYMRHKRQIGDIRDIKET